MKLMEGFSAAKHAPKGQKLEAFVETALGYTPLAKYERPLETKIGPVPQETSTAQAYSDLMRLAEIMGNLKAKTIIAESESDNYCYKVTSRLKGIADIVEKARVIAVNARHFGMQGASTASEAQDHAYEAAVRRYLDIVEQKNAYRAETERLFEHGSDAGELEKRLDEIQRTDGIDLTVWNHRIDILGALKAGYTVITQIAKAGVPIEGDLAQAAKIVLRYQDVDTLEGFLTESQLAAETARVNADQRIRVKHPSVYTGSKALYGVSHEPEPIMR
ncbi:hypothetical protein JXB02_00360 [Candidatus Woesearchaeota archaeon]|nr:hypothetical protein [Candidatus Woesearchaeota archaeon]